MYSSITQSISFVMQVQRYAKAWKLKRKFYCGISTQTLQILQHYFFLQRFIAELQSLKPLLIMMRKFGKEVMLKYHTDAEQQAGVDTLLLEQAVNIGAVASQFASKPSDTSLLAL